MINKSIIIIPTYNESENIELIINKIISNDDSNDVLVVDDNSPDGTSKLVENQKNIHNNRVFLIKRNKKSGLGSAYKAGFKWALENNYSYIFEMDADMSHDPDEIKNLNSKVFFMRHALAPGNGDPENFKLDDCSTQRNLSNEGINQASEIAKEFKNYNWFVIGIDKDRCQNSKYVDKFFCKDLITFDSFLGLLTFQLL